ncbi:MAG: Alcohol dehydrogenase GroES domain protein [Marmoricola sp.]|jgi:alcohol dehydrogenase|nr:Alcohol dehydrogenase GroES domain protein [Marmoricola sp.]
MRAVVYHPDGVQVADVPDARVRLPDDVVVEVTHAAVCGTDLHLLAHPAGLRPGTVLGHEFVGRVVEVGSRVATVAVGDRVVAGDYTSCGRCWWCRGGRHWHCEQRQFFGTGTSFGAELDGGQAERVRVPFADTCLRVLPESIASVEALVLGDTFATGYAAAKGLGGTIGDVVAVVGGGPVGLLSALSAQLAGAAHVVLVEPVEQRRALAARLGCVAASPDSAREAVDAVTDGRGADGVIDAVGAPVGLDTAYVLVRRAGTISSVGVPAEDDYRLDAAACFARELTTTFVVGNFLRDADRLLPVLASGLLPTSLFLDTGYTMGGASEAYVAMQERRTTKAVMTR